MEESSNEDTIEVGAKTDAEHMADSDALHEFLISRKVEPMVVARMIGLALGAVDDKDFTAEIVGHLLAAHNEKSSRMLGLLILELPQPTSSEDPAHND